MKLTCRCGASGEFRDNFAGTVDANRWQERHENCQRPSEPVPRSVFDLLAVIHRDGGHYREAHGLDKAARDATLRYIDILAALGACDAALSQCQPCADPECCMTQRDYIDTARASVARLLTPNV